MKGSHNMYIANVIKKLPFNDYYTAFTLPTVPRESFHFTIVVFMM